MSKDPPPASAEPVRISVYAQSLAGYADHIVVRQARAVGADQILVTRPTSLDVGDRLVCLAPSRETWRVLSRRSARAIRRTGVEIGPDTWASLRLRRALHDADVVYTRFLDQAVDLLAPLAGRERPAVVAVAAGSDITTVRSRSSSHIRAVRSIISRSDALLCNSKFLERKVKELVSSTRTAVHHPGIFVPPGFHQRTPDEDFVVLAVSRLVPVKGVDRSIRAFNAAFAGVDGARMRVLGDGPSMSDLQQLVHELGLTEQVDFVGQVTQAEVFSEMLNADLLVQHNVRTDTGAEEGLPASLLQAGAHGLPVVAARSGGVEETVIDGKSAFLVESEDTDTMADALRAVRDSSRLRADMGRAGYEYVRAEHNAEVQDQRLGELLRSATA